MTPLKVGRWLCALVLAAGSAAPANAAWDNVFQVCGLGCRRPAVSRYYASAYCCPQPQPCCTTQYVQRSYYQPVTCYQTQSYYEPVTTYRTSYYYEPVTSYRYSCYYDPCTCSYQQVACPTTSYRLRAQSCAVTSYLQRTCQVPVTSYRLSYYLEPVTTCAAPAPCPPPCPPAFSNGYAPPAAGVGERPSTPPTGVYEQPAPGATQQQQFYPPPSTSPPPAMPPATGSSTQRQLTPLAPVPAAPAPPPPTVRLDRIVAVPSSPENGSIEGQVVQVNNAPRGNVQVTFVRADRQETQQPVTADGSGKFAVQLASGNWLVYMTGGDGKPVFHSRIDVRAENRNIVLVSR